MQSLAVLVTSALRGVVALVVLLPMHLVLFLELGQHLADHMAGEG